MYVYRANRTSRDLICQSKGFKCIERFKLFNCCRRLDRGFSYNTFFEDDDDEAFKDVEIEFESDLDLKLKSFIYVIKNFDLNNSKFSCFIDSLSFNNNVEDFGTKGSYFVAFNKSKKSLKWSPNRSDLLLYDIDIIDHIVNDRKWFKDDYTFNKG